MKYSGTLVEISKDSFNVNFDEAFIYKDETGHNHYIRTAMLVSGLKSADLKDKARVEGDCDFMEIPNHMGIWINSVKPQPF